MLYLAPYIGSGTRADPFRPNVPLGTKYAALSLRPSTNQVDGRCLLWIPGETRVLTQLDQIADGDKSEILTAAARASLGSRLSRTIDTGSLEQVIGDLMFKAGNPWTHVVPNARGLKEVWIGGRLWATKQVDPPINGELVDPTDNFNRANETPIAGNWTTGFSGWASARLLSNTFAGPAADADSAAYYNAFTPQADQFCEVEVGAGNGGDGDGGPCVRMDTASMSCYMLITRNGNWQLYLVNPTFTVVQAFTESGADPAIGDKVLLSIAGSSLRSYVRGGQLAESPTTDATISAARRIGIGAFPAAQRYDNWRGGDGDGLLVAHVPPPVLLPAPSQRM